MHYHGLPITAFTQKADKPSVFVDSHWHDWYEAIYIVDGEIKQKLGSTVKTLSTGTFILVQPYELHETISVALQCELLVAMFTSEAFAIKTDNRKRLKYLDVFLGNTKLKSGYILAPHKYQHEIHSTMKRMSEVCLSNDIGSQMMLMGSLLEFISYLQKSSASFLSETKEKHYDNRIYSICRYIEDNFAEYLLVRDVAKAFGYSDAHLSRLFFTQTGQNIKQYIDYVKVNEAEQILISDKTTISEVAYQVGFSNVNSFSRAFKRLKGYMPSLIKKVKE